MDAAKFSLMGGYRGTLEVEDDKTGAGCALINGTDEAVPEDVVVVVAAVVLWLGVGRAVVHGGGNPNVRVIRGTLGHAKGVVSIPQEDRRGGRSQCALHMRIVWIVKEVKRDGSPWVKTLGEQKSFSECCRRVGGKTSWQRPHWSRRDQGEGPT